MNRSDETLFDPRIADWLEDDPHAAPGQALEVVLAAFPSIKQRRTWRVPWRFPDMSSLSKFVALAAAVILVVLGVYLLGPRLGNAIGGPPPTASPSPSPTAMQTPTVSPSPSTAAAATQGGCPGASPAEESSPTSSPSLSGTSSWVTYQSCRYDFSIGYPADWTVNPSDHDWTLAGDGMNAVSSGYESFINPEGHVRVSAWNVPRELAEGNMWDNSQEVSWRNVEAWAQAYCEGTTSTPCTGIGSRALPLCLERWDCHPALLVPFTDDVQAFFTNGGEGAPMTIVAVWRGPSDYNVALYGRSQSLLEAFISTMGVLRAEDSPYAGNRDAAARYLAGRAP